MKKFLIINPFGIGDVLFTTPVIRSIRDSYPEARIGYWSNERTNAVLEDNPCINKIFPLSRGDIKRKCRGSWFKWINSYWGLFSRIKREGFDISLDFSLDHRYSLISKLSGIKRRAGFNYKNRGRFLTDKIDIDGYKNKHIVEYYLELLNFIGIKPRSRRLELYIKEEVKEQAGKTLYNLGVRDTDLLVGVACAAGASWGDDAELKRWPARNFAELADKIIDDYGAKILILGDESERQVADRMAEAMRNKPIDLVGKTKLEEFAAVINKINLLITNDGGPLHIAAALGKKTVSFFGPVDPLVYGPYPPDKNKHIVLRRNLECSPCYRKFRLSRCRRGRECLEGISVEDALSAVRNLLPAR